MVTIWKPPVLPSDRPVYVAIADTLAEDIRNGTLAEEARLPAIRTLAKSLNVTAGTINRAYKLAEKRGLIASETGRGSFVRSLPRRPQIPQLLPDGTANSHCDLTLNAPVSLDLENILSGTLTGIGKQAGLNELMGYGNSRGPAYHRKVISRWLKRRQINTSAGELILSSGGQQALATLLSTLTRTGDNVLVEELTYSGAKNFARLHGLQLIPVQMDEQGLRPDDLQKQISLSGARTLVCMPSQHNPTSRSMSLERRQEVVSVALDSGLHIIEDDVYLRENELPTLQQLLPEQTFHITSFSKILAPGLRTGVIVSPPEFVNDITHAAQTSSWMPSPLLSEILIHWIEAGIADEIESQRQEATRKRVELARKLFTGLRVESSTAATHLWLSLQFPWTAESFTRELHKSGINVTPSDYFSVRPDRNFAAVRVAIGLPTSEKQLEEALRVIARTARCPPGPAAFGF